ncbi:M20 family metallopeptidase [Planomicrobium sp. CPCC 101079]|uniref:M20 metallopeptidase family protein n=1 Tax=Planomicrobium sp. CPCC 101079 TaxID=2599618 RepID=UPI0011B5D98D|nr:amidohydrolase [Planomicrobium sp. CPCC 101079]TWT03459.1 amidohydrolase [Planomicrobium sp. CPCC 101079]
MQTMLLNKIDSLFEEMIETRRHLHMHPELSHQEVETPEFIANKLEEMGVEVRRGVGGNGVVGYIRGGKPGRTIAFRADFDALPIDDKKEVAYKSTVPGVMHACGHDGHTAGLLGFAKAMAAVKDELPGTIVLIHQFGEEAPPGGSRAMIADGCLDGVNLVYGAHVQSSLEHGKVFVRDGFLQASEDTIKIVVRGSGTHGAEPHLGVDPILAASHIMIALQSIVSRNTDPLQELVVTIGKFHAGEADNVIPSEAVLEGTIRVFNPELRKLASERVAAIAENVALAMGASAEVMIESGYDSLWNHPEATDIVRTAARSAIGEEAVMEIQPVMPVEDFAYYTQAVPGAFFFVGAKMAEESLVYPHHHENFDFNEEAMLIAAKVFAAVYIEAQTKMIL